MIFIGTMIATAAVAIFFTILFANRIGSAGGRWGIFRFFVLLFLLTWVGGIWMVPAGPAFYGIFVINFVIWGGIVALLTVVLSPAPDRNRKHDRLHEEEEHPFLGGWFWVLVVILLALAIWRHTR